MLNKKLLLWMLIAFISLTSFVAIGQNQNSLWYFGDGAALDFRMGEPKARNESKLRMLLEGGSPSITSDPITGSLLFYTDGKTVWNKNDQPMVNGENLKGGILALVTPEPNSNTIFNLFTLSGLNIFGEEYELYHHKIDMSLQNGLGDVVLETKNKLLLSNLSQKLTAITHANGSDYWIITHESGSKKFFVSRLSSDGLTPFQPQAIGQDYTSTLYENQSINIGYLKASPNGQLIAESIGGEVENPLNLFSFDRTTGVISNHLPLKSPGIPFGLSFSPDNSKLYVSFGIINSSNPQDQFNAIYQYQVNILEKDRIDESCFGMISNNPFTNIDKDGGTGGPLSFSLQIAPDGRIYSGDNWLVPRLAQSHYLLVIEKPNLLGFNATINIKKFDFGSGQAAALLPNFIEMQFNELESRTTCAEESSISIYPNPTNDLVTLGFVNGCDSNYDLQIVNLNGQQVGHYKNLLFNKPLNLSALGNGVYICIISTSYGKNIIKRIVKI